MKSGFKELLYLLVLLSTGIILTGASVKYGLESRLMIMKFPIILAGFLLSINYAVASAFILPILCTVLYGEPAAFPNLPLIICETVALTSFSNIYYNSAHLKIYPSLVITLVMGELVLFSAASILSWVTHNFSAVGFTIDSFLHTLPGLAVQFAFIPIIVKLSEIIKSKMANQRIAD